jgi:hypothetical protein
MHPVTGWGRQGLCFAAGMPTKSLEELQVEVEAALRSASMKEDDRALLKQVQSDLQTALAKPEQAHVPHTLRESLREAIDRFQSDHPGLTSMLAKTLDTLSDIGV